MLLFAIWITEREILANNIMSNIDCSAKIYRDGKFLTYETQEMDLYNSNYIKSPYIIFQVISI